MNKYPKIFLVCLPIIIYLLLRLNWTGSVMFNYDMPRVALQVQSFLTQGNYLNSQQFVEESSWHNLPWGPSLVWFYAPFLKITPHPLYASLLVGVFNVLSIIFVIWLGWKFFSPVVGVVAATLLATQPYWVLFSRIIYQPTPVITFISVSMLFTFYVVKRNKSALISLVIITWAVLIQIYLPTFSFIVTSFVFLLAKFKQISLKYTLVGLIGALIIFIPTIKYYLQNPVYISKFVEAPSLFTPPEKTTRERLANVVKSYFTTLAGDNLSWDLGYAQNDFLNGHMSAVIILDIIAVGFGVVIMLAVLRVFFDHSDYFLNLILCWALAPIWFLVIVRVSDMVPRYFLSAFPAFCLLFALNVEYFINLIKRYLPKLRYSVLVIPLAISAFWITGTIKFDQFIADYSFPFGKLNNTIESPYRDLEQAINWIYRDSVLRGYRKVFISDEINHPGDASLWLETTYTLKYVFAKPIVTSLDNQTGQYLLIWNNQNIPSQLKYYQRFGPFITARTQDLTAKD